MKKGDVYRKAAFNMEHAVGKRGHCLYSCLAVDFATGYSDDSHSLEANLYAAAFTPGDTMLDYQRAIYRLRSETARHNFRILALCFAAAMADAGDL